MTAAIRADHQHIVKLLLPKITNEALELEFALTAAYEGHHILEQIFKFATELDFQGPGRICQCQSLGLCNGAPSSSLVQLPQNHPILAAQTRKDRPGGCTRHDP